MRSCPTSIQSLENIQFPNISNVSRYQSPLIPTVTTCSQPVGDEVEAVVFGVALEADPIFQGAEVAADAVIPTEAGRRLSSRSSANESACVVEESLFDDRVWNFSPSAVSNELRNARTSHPCERGAGFLKFKNVRKPASPISAFQSS